MASIHKLSIRGIRSFSHEREQVIEFYTPLTMIVGANGCGKTTVIECLKYACTGALPPGARNGQSFVHDPKVSGTNEVKANIKLRFSGRDARVSVVIRSFQLTQKRVTLQFKALDGVIRTKDDNGASVSITHKCTELDKHIPLRLGVSKAILENVVFCHQEDASWPLQEGAVVKKKFDDIFESARYTKALETIKKTKQEYAGTVKDLKIDLAGLQERLRAAETLKSELETSRENYDSIRGEVEAIDARTRELSESLDKLRAVADQLDMLEAQKQSLQLTCRDLDVRIGEKRENVGDAMSNESDEVLETNLREFDEKLDRCADEIKFCNDEAAKSTARALAAKNTKGSLKEEQGSLKAQLSHQERVVAERDSFVERLSGKYQIFNPAPSAASVGGSESSGARTRYTSEDVSSFEAALQRALEEAREALKEARAKARREDDAMMAEINKLKLEQRSITNAVRTKERELGKTSADSVSHAQSGGPGGSQSQGAGASEQRLRRQLDSAHKTAETAAVAFARFESENQTRQTNKDCKKLEKRLGDLKSDMEAQEDVVQELGSQQEEQSKLSIKTAQIADDEADLQEKVEASVNFNKSLEHKLQDVTAASLTDALEEVRVKREEAEQDRASKAREVVDLSAEQGQKNITLDKTVHELSQVQHRVLVLSGGALKAVREEAEVLARRDTERGVLDPETQFNEMMTTFREHIARKNKAINLLAFRASYTNNVLELAEMKGQCCPTCERNMNDQEYRKFLAVQAANLNEDRMIKKRQEAERELEKLKFSVAKLEANSQEWHEWTRLSPRPAELKAKKERTIAEKEQIDDSLEEAEHEVNGLRRSREDLDHAVSQGEKLVVEANRINKERFAADLLKENLRSYGHRESLSEARERLKEIATNKDKAMTNLQAKNRELQRLTATQLRLTNDKTRAERELDRATASLREKQEWDKKKEEFKEREKTLQGELKDLKAEEQPLRQQLQEKNNSYTRARDQARANVDRFQGSAQECQTDVGVFSRAQKEVAAGVARKLPEALISVQARLREVEAAVEEHEEAAKEYERTMTGKVLQSDKQVHHKKILKDNIEYRGYNRELEQIQKEVAAVEAEIAETDSQDVRGKIEELNRDVQKRTQKRAELKGRLHGMKDQIRGFEHKLATEAYHHIEEKHRRKMIEHRTTEMAVTDLDKYWTALDKALLRFHTMKIADINKIIRELWAMTYSGEDIDMIEIVSGDDDDVGKAKRSYNYRVVMRKNDATLDMKGRCSAGQRVLASVVIRLALAETFCVSCGILALDEPTTNLDHNNKVGLAHALAKIISNRSKQSNFQLITITHDEEFVQTMRTELGTQGGFSMPEFYWRISREEMSRGKFYSRIDRLDWEDM